MRLILEIYSLHYRPFESCLATRLSDVDIVPDQTCLSPSIVVKAKTLSSNPKHIDCTYNALADLLLEAG